MNSYKLNAAAGHATRLAIIENLNISHIEIYKIVKDIKGTTLILHDKRKFKLVLEEIKQSDKIE
jgi:hypothetical protein